MIFALAISSLTSAYVPPTASTICSSDGTQLEAISGFQSLLEGEVISYATGCKVWASSDCVLVRWGTYVEVQCADKSCGVGSYPANANKWQDGGMMVDMTRTVVDLQTGNVVSGITSHATGASATDNGANCAVRIEVAPHADGNFYVAVAAWNSETTPTSTMAHSARTRVLVNADVATTTTTTTTTVSTTVSTTTAATTTETVTTTAAPNTTTTTMTTTTPTTSTIAVTAPVAAGAATVICSASGTQVEAMVGFQSLFVDSVVSSAKGCRVATSPGLSQCVLSHWVDAAAAKTYAELQCSGGQSCGIGSYPANDNTWHPVSSGIMQDMTRSIVDIQTGELLSTIEPVHASGMGAVQGGQNCAVRIEVQPRESGKVYVAAAVWSAGVNATSNTQHSERSRIRLDFGLSSAAQYSMVAVLLLLLQAA